jgi:WD40 repeat protein
VNALALNPQPTDSLIHPFWAASSDGNLYEIELIKPSKAEGGGLLLKRVVPLSRRLSKTGLPLYWESLVLHPRKALAYVLSRFGTLATWDWEEDWLQTFRDTAEVSYALAMPSHAKALYLGSGSGAIYVLEPNELSIQKVLRGHREGVRGLALSYDERLLASAGLDGKVMIWQMPEGLRIRTLEGHQDGVRAVAFSPDGRYLASAGKDGLVIIWNVALGTREKIIDLGTPLWCVAFSPNGQYLVAGGNDGLLRLWRIDQLGIRPAQILADRDELYRPPVELEDNVPVCTQPKPYRYAYIIGNEDYRTYQPTFTPAMNVPYAIRDAYAFRMYAEQVLGIPPKISSFSRMPPPPRCVGSSKSSLSLPKPARGRQKYFSTMRGMASHIQIRRRAIFCLWMLLPGRCRRGAFG